MMQRCPWNDALHIFDNTAHEICLYHFELRYGAISAGLFHLIELDFQ